MKRLFSGQNVKQLRHVYCVALAFRTEELKYLYEQKNTKY